MLTEGAKENWLKAPPNASRGASRTQVEAASEDQGHKRRASSAAHNSGERTEDQGLGLRREFPVDIGTHIWHVL